MRNRRLTKAEYAATLNAFVLTEDERQNEEATPVCIDPKLNTPFVKPTHQVENEHGRIESLRCSRS